MAKIIANAAARYIAGPSGVEPFWQWQDQGRVVVWNAGTKPTIAFTQEIEAVIEGLAPQGLPPFGSVLLLLASCQGWWCETSMNEARIEWGLLGEFDVYSKYDYLEVLRDLLDKQDISPDAHGWREACGLLCKAAIEGLQRVHDLPENLRSGLDAKVDLAKTVFEPCSMRRDLDFSRSVVIGLDAGLPSEMLDGRSGGTTMADILIALYMGLFKAPLDEQRLRLLRRTGLESLPEPADVELPTGQAVRELIDKCRDDKELAGLAALARDLMAVVHLPRRLAEPENLPIGGFSDITNRGTPDRLLLSELVHDNLTLAVRVALNEALYWRRESPRRNEVVRRRILVDSGIRLWGIPRVYAAAVALAAAATAPVGAQVECYCCHSKQLVPVNLSSQAGLIELLEALETEAHPGEAINAFLNPANSPADADNILITHADVLADADFQRHLGEADNSHLYVVSVDREGNYRLITYSGLSHRLLSEARLDLSSILADDRQRVELVDEAETDRLPAACRLKEFPLLLPVPIDWERAAWRKDTGLVHATNDGRLMQWRQPNRGARQVTARVPNVATWQTILLDGQQCCLVPTKFSNPLTLLTVDLETGSIEAHEVSLPEEFESRLAVCPIRGGLGLMGRRAAMAVSCQTGEVFGPLDLSSTVDMGDVPAEGIRVQQNIFRNASSGRPGWHECFVLTLDGRNIRTVDMSVPPEGRHPLKMVSRVDEPWGTWGLYSDGTILYLNEDWRSRLREFKTLDETPVLGPSADGRRLCVRSVNSNRTAWVCYELSEPEPKRHVVDDRDSALRFLAGCPEGLACLSIDTSAIVYQFGKIAVGKIAVSPGHVYLQRQDKTWLTIRGGSTPCWELNEYMEDPPSEDAATPDTAEFSQAYCAKGSCYQLRQASWPSGAKAWLDSRGLLHLKSSDGNSPEVSLVLGPPSGILAGWASMGLKVGDQRFFSETVIPDNGQIRTMLDEVMLGI